MDIRSGNIYPAGALSNFTAHSFIFRNVQCNSMEGLLQGLKFHDIQQQLYACSLYGYTAKKFGKSINWQETQTLYWNTIPIYRSSQEYQDLLDEAYNALFDQNIDAREALLISNNAILTHSVGWHKQNETILTASEFCSRLMNIRNRIKAENFLSF